MKSLAKGLYKLLTLTCISFFISHCLTFDFQFNIPIAPLGDKNHWVLISIPLSKWEDFQIRTNKKYSKPYIQNGNVFIPLSKSEWESINETFDYIKINISNVGFKFFDGSHPEQLSNLNFDLTNLKSGYKDNLLNTKYLNQIVASFPMLASLEEIGKTKNKHPILALKITKKNFNENQKVSILFSCAMHANEVISTDHCYDIIHTLLENQKYTERYLNKLNIWIIPIVNPEGSDAFWNQSHLLGRKNDSTLPNLGVDLNRNFPIHWGKSGSEYSSDKKDSPYFRGLHEGSELETQALIHLFERENFVASISFHAFANSLLYPYSIEGFQNPEPDLAKEFGRKLTRFIRSTNSNKPFKFRKNIYPVDGVDQDFYYFKYGTLAYIFETSHFNPEYKHVGKIIENYRIVWLRLLDEISFGKKLLYRILDEEGNPIKANVQLENHKFFQGETRQNHPTTGIYYSYYTSEMLGNITFSSDGYLPMQQKTKATSSFEPLEIRLKKLP
ncbi:MAG: M14 family zinc carboxypeptidase [Leptospira sp.]|nr:M14 family zinc carboxypeptidase [Leptospira sp.]